MHGFYIRRFGSKRIPQTHVEIRLKKASGGEGSCAWWASEWLFWLKNVPSGFPEILLLVLVTSSENQNAFKDMRNLTFVENWK